MAQMSTSLSESCYSSQSCLKMLSSNVQSFLIADWQKKSDTSILGLRIIKLANLLSLRYLCNHQIVARANVPGFLTHCSRISTKKPFLFLPILLPLSYNKILSKEAITLRTFLQPIEWPWSRRAGRAICMDFMLSLNGFFKRTSSNLLSFFLSKHCTVLLLFCRR